jgi:hypothetical protein
MSTVNSPEDIGNLIDLTNIINSAKKNFAWNDEQTRIAVEWYLRYLYLCFKHQNKYIAAISHSADDLWHQHIIDTSKYSDDCNLLFGRFLPHQPIYGEPSSSEMAIYNDTQQLYQKEFGRLPPDMRPTSGNYSYSKG